MRTAQCIGLFVASLPVSAHASISNWGYVTDYAVLNSSGAALFYTDGPRTGTPPACNTATNRWAVHNPASISTLLTAISTHKRVWISGSNDCGVHSDSESAEYLKLEQ